MKAESKGTRGRPKVEGLVERRQEQILAVATDVFAESGFRSTDVQEIADRIGVGKGTVYRYFPSKEELFLGTVRRVMEQLTDALRVVFHEVLEPLSRVRCLVEAFLDFFEKHPEFVEVLILERAEFRSRGRLTFFEYKEVLYEEFHSLDEALEDADILRHAPGGPEADAFSQLLYGVIFTARYAGDESPREQQRAVLLDLLFRGLLK